MKREWIELMKKSGKLKLTFWENTSHYLIVVFLFIPLILSIYGFFEYYITKTYTGVRTPFEMFNVSYPFAFLGLLFYFIQNNRLKFKVIQTNLSKEKLLEIIKETGNELEWRTEKKTNDYFINVTNPKWSSGSWGERITIIIDNNRILINSICDPDKKSSVISAGRNKKNVNTLIQNIKKASC